MYEESRIETARQLMEEGAYAAARSVLETIADNPDAQALLRQIDRLDPEGKPKRDSDDNPFVGASAEAEKPKRGTVVVGQGGIGGSVSETVDEVFGKPGERDYAAVAVLTLILYWLAWLPGFVVNLWALNEANQTERRTGQPAQGKGCLVALLWFNVVPFLCFCLCFCTLTPFFSLFG